MRHLVIPSQAQGLLLSSFLKKRFPKGYVEKVFRKNGVRVNGKRGKRDTIIQEGDELTFYVPLEEKSLMADTASIASSILFEDDDILVLNKKAGIAVHEGKNIPLQKTVIGQLTAYYQPQGIIPYLVHRLDRDTSGCLLVVKKEQLVPVFEKMFEGGKVQKEYIALVKGVIKKKKGEITKPLPGRDKTLVSAKTIYTVDKVFPLSNVSLVRVIIQTGRMHQIRLHFASIDHPVVMDDEHGNFAFNRQFRKRMGLKRQFLHANRLSFVYQNKEGEYIAPLPKDLTKVIEQLE